MNALLRSAVLGSLFGIATLLGFSMWFANTTRTEEPRPFPDETLSLRELEDSNHQTRRKIHVDPYVQVPYSVDDQAHPGKPVGFHTAANAALVNNAVVGAALPTVTAVTLGGTSGASKDAAYKILDSNTSGLVLAGDAPVFHFATSLTGQQVVVNDKSTKTGLKADIVDNKLALKSPLAPGRHELEIAVGNVVSNLELFVPSQATVIKRLSIEETADGDLAPLRPSQSANPIQVNAFGKPASLRVSGGNLSADNIVHVIVVAGNEVKYARAVHPGNRTLSGQWSLREVFPIALTGDIQMFFAQRSGQKLSGFSDEIEIKIDQPGANLAGAKLRISAIGAKSIPADGTVLLNNRKSTVTATWDGEFATNLDVVLHAFVDSNQQPYVSAYVDPASNSKEVELPDLPTGTHTLLVALQQGNGPFSFSKAIKYSLRTEGPHVESVGPDNFGIAPEVNTLKVAFNRENKIRAIANEQVELRPGNGLAGFSHAATAVIRPRAVQKVSAEDNSFLLIFETLDPNSYELTLLGTIQDEYGNALVGTSGKAGTPDVRVLGRTPSDEDSVDPRGVIQTSGRYVPYQEFTKPRAQHDGFNPSDKVETRVARLYYFRDAHRVAQIINRKVQSFNRQGVDTARQLADRARNVAEQKAMMRQQAERAAVEKAQKTRAKENELRRLENTQTSTLNEIARAKLEPLPMPQPGDAEGEKKAKEAKDERDQFVSQMEATAKSIAAKIDTTRSQIQDLRDDENIANETVQRAEADEKQAASEQFRREVAAARSDPDTYAAGKPESDDPVEQVSVSVIGEGLIQLRGPIKGINQIRTMIDQIDAPVGQVRVAVHTVQLNGEHANRMEEVSAASQRYIDQSRFLTLQSGELLRRSVVQVAAHRADDARGIYPGETQDDRDHRYLYGYFGRDFIEELRAMDSEFLRTGNKLLSLHSMDTTSLSSALMLMALARNDTRMEILQQFEEFCQGQLPQSEQNWFEQQWACGLKKHHLGKLCKPPDFVPLAGNARFESLRGFFAADVAHQDTMTPLQREFLRLAQILKSRLIVEMELKQRVTERAIIEERGVDRSKDVQEALKREREANDAVARFEKVRSEQQGAVLTMANQLQAIASNVFQQNQMLADRANCYMNPFVTELVQVWGKGGGNPGSDAERIKFVNAMKHQYTTPEQAWEEVRSAAGETGPKKGTMSAYVRAGNSATTRTRYGIDENGALVDQGSVNVRNNSRVANADQSSLFYQLGSDLAAYIELAKALNRFHYEGDVGTRDYVAELQELARLEINSDTYVGIQIMTYEILDELMPKSDHVSRRTEELTRRMNELVEEIADTQSDIRAAYQDASELIAAARKYIRVDTEFGQDVLNKVAAFEESFGKLLQAEVNRDFARRSADLYRRPLDHKKFLDMLIDETEDKYIELLEGTRAHTANIDNYIKRLTTALDDDFNSQFYNPAFRLVRESSARRYYNVNFGQIETTSILANNRAFAKVSPAASMEFDLPHRDILLSEALNGALAVYRDVGALANDPSFLATAKMKAGQSAATPAPGSTGGFSVVRNVVPGLSADTTEQVMAQNANGGQQFGSNLENLIPDPAIYKFETGTGYEIRPVIQPDGQAVVFGFQYLYTSQIREPVRADEKHLGRIKRHFIDTDVQLSNFELREVSRYIIALKASRTAKGVPLLEDIPIAGALFRPAPSDESSLQQNLVMAQATIFPTLFDLMGLRWAPVVADLDPLRMQNDEFVVRGRNKMLRDRVYELTSEKVDDFLRVPQGNRRPDMYRSQGDIPRRHPNGYEGPGLNQRDSTLREGYSPQRMNRDQPYVPQGSREGSPLLPGRTPPQGVQPGQPPLQEALPRNPDPEPIRDEAEPNAQGASRRRMTQPYSMPNTVNPASYAAAVEPQRDFRYDSRSRDPRADYRGYEDAGRYGRAAPSNNAPSNNASNNGVYGNRPANGNSTNNPYGMSRVPEYEGYESSALRR